MNKAITRMLFIASAFAAVPAQAEPPILVEGQPTAIVGYGDLDLSRPAGQAALGGRVHRAAARLCASDMNGIGPAMEQRRCFSLALASARPQVDRAIALYGNPQFAGRAGLTVASR